VYVCTSCQLNGQLSAHCFGRLNPVSALSQRGVLSQGVLPSRRLLRVFFTLGSELQRISSATFNERFRQLLGFD
jgi:hypothetical protein